MIFIGLSEDEKRRQINEYAAANGIKQVIVFSCEKFFLNLPNPGCLIRQIGYNETIMYRTFYPLLEEIDDTYLLVMNECMRSSNRSELTYNCIAKYTNQTPHRMVFEYFPIISDPSDLLILVDFDKSQQYKGRSLNEIDLDSIDISCTRAHYTITGQNIELPPTAKTAYEVERERLFDELGSKDPDTIPRNLHLWCGRYKKAAIDPSGQYVARNSRFKNPNITTFKNARFGGRYTLLDIPHRRLDFNDFLRVTGQQNLSFLSTGFNVDKMYINDFNKWSSSLEAIYAKTGLYQAAG